MKDALDEFGGKILGGDCSNGQQKMEGLYKELSEYEVSSKYGKWVYFLNESGTTRISKYYGND